MTEREALRSVLAELHRRIDGDVRAVEGAEDRFVCPAPCSACCASNLFVVTGIEFLGLALWAGANLSPEVRDRAVREAREQLEACSVEETLRRERDDEPGGDGALPCPLLAEGRCLVYAVRPVTCRLFGRSAFADGRWNGCVILAVRFQGAAPPKAPLPVVEGYSRVLAGLLCESLEPEALERVGPLVGVSSLPDFIARTGFDPKRVAEACRALEG